MCYEERLFRSWVAKKAQKRAPSQPVTERDRSQAEPMRSAPADEPKPRKEREREPEEIV